MFTIRFAMTNKINANCMRHLYTLIKGKKQMSVKNLWIYPLTKIARKLLGFDVDKILLNIRLKLELDP